MALGQNQQNSMKGLQLFIADLRANQRTKDHAKRIHDELVNIRKHLSQKNGLNEYQRKKYIAKMAYIYITTNAGMVPELLFGLDQCFQLLKSKRFSEKWIGYMTLELLFNHPVVRNRSLEKCLSCVKADLNSVDVNVICLALHFIGIAGNCDDIFADNLAESVFDLLRSPASTTLIKRKACLAFLTMVRFKPTIFANLDDKKRALWIDRITTLLGDREDHGLLLSLLPLLEFIAKEIDINPCIKLIPHLTDILGTCLSQKSNTSELTDCRFAGVPNPWLVGKCVALLSVLVSDNGENLVGTSIDQQTLGKLRVCVSHAVSIGSTDASDPVVKNAKLFIMFTMLGFACKLDPTSEAISNSVQGLCELMSSSDLNTRYSTFDVLIKICKVTGKSAISTMQKQHLAQLFEMLNHESDVTLLRKITDLLFMLIDNDNFKIVVEQLLKALEDHRSMDFPLKELLTLRIEEAIETHADDLNWFVLSSLRLLSANTSVKSGHVWKRICQIVVNNEPLHKLACEHLIEYLQSPNIAESLVKAGVFLLAEYAPLVHDIASTGDLFNLFTGKYFQVSNLTKAMILTGMLKLYHADPQLSSVVVKFFQLELNSFDIILQTRSYEYLKLIQYSKINDMSFIDKIMPGMPPFEGGKTADVPAKLPKHNELFSLQDALGTADPEDRSKQTNGPIPTPPQSRKNNKLYHAHQLTPGWETGFKRMLIHKQGVFYQDSVISVLFRCERISDQPSKTNISLTLLNKTNYEITGLSCETIPFKTEDNPPYIIQVTRSADSKLSPASRTSYGISVTTRFPFPLEQSPLISVQFNCSGQHMSYRMKLGYTVISTLYPTETGMNLTQFVQRWKSIVDTLGEVGENSDTAKCSNMSLQKIKDRMLKIGFNVVEQSAISNTVFIGGIIHTKSDGNFGCLLKLKLNSFDNQIEISCKTTSTSDLSRHVVGCIKKAIDQ